MSFEMMENKRGQVAIYVIVAVVIVGVLAVALLFPDLRPTLIAGEFSPQSYLRDCVDEDVRSGVERLSRQGGYENPEGFITHEGEKIKYLCYTSGDYEPCVVQQPMVKNHFEGELGGLITPKADECARNLKAEYERRGYGVSSGAVSSQVSIIPGNIRIDFLAPMTVTKESTETFSGFDLELKSEMYDLLLTSQSIIDFESTYGDSETTLYLQYYPDLKVEKMKQGDGSTIYILGNVVTGEEFRFASRSLVWPPGFGN
jgi:hypothetical protein